MSKHIARSADRVKAELRRVQLDRLHAYATAAAAEPEDPNTRPDDEYGTELFARFLKGRKTPVPAPSAADFAAAVGAAIAAGSQLEAALAYATRGFAVFPLDPTSKKPIPAKDKDENGNPIAGTGGHYKATCDQEQIRKWWKRHPERLIGMPMGARTGVWATDIDTGEDHADGVAVWKKLAGEHPAIVTREHRSATGGPHLIFIWEPDRPIACGSGALPAGIHVKGMGGYIAVPPSKRKGRAYTVFKDIDPIVPPQWLVEIILGDRERTSVAPDAELVADDPDKVAYAVSKTTNNLKDWPEWKRYVMAIFNSLGGDGDAMSLIVHEFSERWTKGEYDVAFTDKCIEEVIGCPPLTQSRGKTKPVGVATVYAMADKSHPRWRAEYERQMERQWVHNYKERDQAAAAKTKTKNKPLIDDTPAPAEEVEYTSIKPKSKDEVQPLPTQKHGDAPPTPIEWLVHNRLEKIGPGLMPGQWGAYKTFIALDLSAHIIIGWDWTGEPVYRQGGVLIFAPEGARSISMRLQAVIDHKIRPLMKHADGLFDPDFPPKKVNLKRLPIEWASTCPPLLGVGKNDPLPVMIATARAAHDRFMAENDLPLALILIDTMATAARFSDESDNAEGSQVLAVMRELAEGAQCFVLAVDHLGKVMEAGSRGASAKEGNADGILAILADKELGGAVKNTRLALRKVREGPQASKSRSRRTWSIWVRTTAAIRSRPSSLIGNRRSGLQRKTSNGPSRQSCCAQCCSKCWVCTARKRIRTTISKKS
jgi:hypothetical protein